MKLFDATIACWVVLSVLVVAGGLLLHISVDISFIYGFTQGSNSSYLCFTSTVQGVRSFSHMGFASTTG